MLVGEGLTAQTNSTVVDFSQATRPMVALTDSATIDFLLFELFIEPSLRPTRLDVIDVTRNGFGPDDVVIAYPSSEVFLIPEFVPDTVQVHLSGWEPEVEYRMDSGNMPSSALAGLLSGDRAEGRRAENAIMFDLVQAVERSYRDLPVALLFQRDSVGFTFQLWDYNRDAMAYTARPALASDSTIATVLTMLEDVGYVPGADVAGLGVTLESAGSGVATVDQALLGVSRMADEEARSLAVRTVLLGSFDFDRSGAIDTAREVDAPSCAVWGALDASTPGYLRDFGFEDAAEPYLGSVMLNIAANVREAVARRAKACDAGEQPQPTDPNEIAPPADRHQLPTAVARFMDAATAAEIIREAASGVPGSADWTRDVRSVLLSRYDLDRSGTIDLPREVRSIPCSVWIAVGATSPARRTSEGPGAGGDILHEDLGFSREQLDTAVELYDACTRPSDGTATVRVRDRITAPLRLPPETIRSAVTVPLRGLADVEDEERRYLPAKTVLLAMFDTDRSGEIDRPQEIDAMSCDVWDALGETFPGYGERFGFVRSPEEVAYRGDFVLAVSSDLRNDAGARIQACARGDAPPRAAASATAAPRPDLVVTAELREFLDLEAASEIARTAVSARPGSAAWAMAVRAAILDRYDLDDSGALDGLDEIDEVPCIVWETLEATYGAPLEGLLAGGRASFVGSQIGIAEAGSADTRARIERCRG